MLDEHLQLIKRLLENKSNAKQITYVNVQELFRQLKKSGYELVQVLRQETHPVEEAVTIEFIEAGTQEFQVKLAGDLIVFILHTNVVTFPDDHPVIKSDYVQSNPVNRYFGQIHMYNFMYDAYRYNRSSDQGVLIGRIMINHEKRFFIEGEEELSGTYGQISDTPLDQEIAGCILKIALKVAIKNDLQSPPYLMIKNITWGQKNDSIPAIGGLKKIGFRMSYDAKQEI